MQSPRDQPRDHNTPKKKGVTDSWFFSSKKTWAVDAATSGVLITLSWVKMSSWTFCEDQDVCDVVTMKIKTTSMMLMKMLMIIIMMKMKRQEGVETVFGRNAAQDDAAAASENI